MIEIRERVAADNTWVQQALEREWKSVIVVSRMRIHHADRLPGLIAYRSERRIGLLTYIIEDQALHVVTLQSVVRRVGAGKALLGAARDLANARGCKRLWLVTTNANAAAISLYGHCGMILVATHRGLMRGARRLKPQIPEFGPDGTPIEDELEFEMSFGEAGTQQSAQRDAATCAR